jgi:hypothetical protein
LKSSNSSIFWAFKEVEKKMIDYFILAKVEDQIAKYYHCIAVWVVSVIVRLPPPLKHGTVPFINHIIGTSSCFLCIEKI